MRSKISGTSVSENFKNILAIGRESEFLFTNSKGEQQIIWDKVFLRCKGNKIYAKFQFKDFATVDAEIDAIDICDGNEVCIDMSSTTVSIA